MTAVFTLWAAEFFIEASGAILNFKRSRLLSFILAIIALMDVVTFFVFRFYPDHYWQATWTRHAIRNMLFVMLGCYLCGIFAEDGKRLQSGITAAFLAIGTGGVAFSIGMSGATIANRLLEGEIVACFLLLAYVALAWIGHNGIPAKDKWIVTGFLLMIGSDLLITMLWMKWPMARRLYPLGAISAYLIWCIGPIKSVRLTEFRKSLGHEIPKAQKVTVI